MAPEQLNEILKGWEACVVAFQNCPACGLPDTVKERFLMLDVPWTVDGVDFKRTGTFVCCEDIDERQMLKNMIYYMLELKKEVLR